MNYKYNLVSVIIPTYNRAHLIGETITSVLAQTFQYFEIIIVDDGSTDNTFDYIKNLASKDVRFKYFKIDHIGVPSKVRNFGLLNAKGKFIAFLDSDDIWMPYKLERQLKEIESNGADWSCSNAFLFNKHNSKSKRLLYNPKNFVSGMVTENLILKYFIVSPSVIIRNIVFEKTGFFDETISWCEEMEYFLRISISHPLIAMREPLLYYRQHAGQLSNMDKCLFYKHTIGALNIFDRKTNYRFKEVKLKISNLWSKIAILQSIKGRDDYKHSISFANNQGKSLFITKLLYLFRNIRILFKLISLIINKLSP
jgi:glycosyltransferase involved in cell wall biosynthesis